MNYQRFKSIVKKELIQLKRDRASFAIALMMPIAMILLFGYSINVQLKDINISIVDIDKSSESKTLIEKFQSDEYFQVTLEDKLDSEIKDDIDRGKFQATLYIPEGFGKKVKDNKAADVDYIVDGSNPTTAKTAESKGIILINLYNKEKAMEQAKNIPNLKESNMIEVNSKILYNEDFRNENFTIPGLIGIILQNVTLLLTAFALVREREKGTIEQLIVSPLTSSEIILGKLTPYIFIGFLDFLFSLALGITIFDVPIAGSLPLLILLGAIFVICSLGMGILISTFSKTQFQAMLMCMIFILPSILLSGFIFPREAMPYPIQILGNFIPLTYFLNIIRGIITKGVGLDYIFNDVFFLTVLSVGVLILSIFRYKVKH